ncbi:MAG TPA: DUF4340 domain-containing protein, partial [Armatimonadota bacterium]|nr:DUF4340 domain-containing protein [Armatimonadota bacterium]
MLGVLGVLGGLYFWDQKAPPPRDPDSPPPLSDFVHLTSADVTSAEVKRPGGGFMLVRRDGKWAFEAPARYRANTETVDNWLKSLLENGSISQEIKPENKKEAPASYGLDKPEIQLILSGRGGQTRALQIGKPFGELKSVYYAREAGSDRMFLVNASQVDDLRNKKVDDLRDKRLVEAPEDKDAQKLTIQRPDGTVEVQRRGEDRWDMVQPFTAAADKLEVESLLSQLRTAEAQKFVENAAADLAKYGLDRPELVLTVTDRKGQPHAVRFGKRDKDGNAYAARAGENEVTLVSRTTFEGL